MEKTISAVGSTECSPDKSIEDMLSLIRKCGNDAIREYRVVRVHTDRPPWTPTGMKLRCGDRISLFSFGRAWLKANPSAWVGSNFGLWMRTSAQGPIFRAWRRSITLTVEAAGELEMANVFPGAWADRTGALASPSQIYQRVAGGYQVFVIL
jgi:hypothetical protein